jgi:cytochrome c553
MHAFAEGRRHSGIMEPIAAGLPEAARHAAADYYAALPPGPRGAFDEAAASRGRRIATRGVSERSVPSCAHCHAPLGAQVNPAYPVLAGQYQPYLVQQLTLLRVRHRGGSEYVHLMHAFVDRLTRDDIRDVAAYFASLEPGGPDRNTARAAAATPR